MHTEASRHCSCTRSRAFPVSQINVTTVRRHLPKGDFSIMTEMLKKFLNFMNLTVSVVRAGCLLLCGVKSGLKEVLDFQTSPGS